MIDKSNDMYGTFTTRYDREWQGAFTGGWKINSVEADLYSTGKEIDKSKQTLAFMGTAVYVPVQDDKGVYSGASKGIVIDRDGKVTGTITVGEDGKPIVTSVIKIGLPESGELKLINSVDKKDTTISADEVKKYKEEYSAAQSRRAVQGFFFVPLAEGAKFGGYSTLFFGKDKVAQWRRDMDAAFCKMYLGGINCWASKICESQYDKSADGTTYIFTPDGMATAAAHVEAERSSPIVVPGVQTQYFYKITFYVRAVDEDVEFNLLLDGVPYFTANKKLTAPKADAKTEEEKRGAPEYIAKGENAEIFYSFKKFSKVCLDFTKGNIKDTCNKIPQSDYSVNNYKKSQQQPSGVPTGIGAAPGMATPAGKNSAIGFA
jgi:hypothetical protein